MANIKELPQKSITEQESSVEEQKKIGEEGVPEAEIVDEKDVEYKLNSAEGVEMVPEARNQLESYLKGKKMTAVELEGEIAKFDKLAKVSRFFEMHLVDDEIKGILESGDIERGITDYLGKSVNKIPFEQLSSLLERLPAELGEISPLLDNCLNRAMEIGAYTEEEYFRGVGGTLQTLSEKLNEHPKSIAKLVELQDDFRILSYKAQPIIDELRGGPFKNLSFKLEETLQPLSQQITNELEEFKNKASSSRINYNNRMTDGTGNFLNPKEFYETNQ